MSIVFPEFSKAFSIIQSVGRAAGASFCILRTRACRATVWNLLMEITSVAKTLKYIDAGGIQIAAVYDRCRARDSERQRAANTAPAPPPSGA